MRSFLKLSLCSAADLGLLSLIGVAATLPAYSQGLTLGAPASSPANPGSGTISGSGTTVIGNYAFSSGAGVTTKAYDTVIALGAGSAASTVTLQTGGSIATLLIGDDSQAIINGGSAGTLTTGSGFSTDNKAGFSITGGTISNINHYSESGLGSISGGTVTTVYAFSDLGSTLNISGGNIGTASISSQGSTSHAVISGGSIQTFNLNGSNLNMSGGSIGNLTLDLYPEGSTGIENTSNAFITGGHVSTLDTYGYVNQRNSPATPVNATCTIIGGTFDTLIASYYGGYDIYGSDLQLTKNNYITGFLSDGEPIDALYVTGQGGILTGQGTFLNLYNSAPIPEASTTVSLGLLLILGTGGLALAKRRRAVTAPLA